MGNSALVRCVMLLPYKDEVEFWQMMLNAAYGLFVWAAEMHDIESAEIFERDYHRVGEILDLLDPVDFEAFRRENDLIG